MITVSDIFNEEFEEHTAPPLYAEEFFLKMLWVITPSDPDISIPGPELMVLLLIMEQCKRFRDESFT